jgi:hypothetical protein
MGALWTAPDSDDASDALQAGRFAIDLPKRPMAVAVAAPGMR